MSLTIEITGSDPRASSEPAAALLRALAGTETGEAIGEGLAMCAHCHDAVTVLQAAAFERSGKTHDATLRRTQIDVVTSRRLAARRSVRQSCRVDPRASR